MDKYEYQEYTGQLLDAAKEGDFAKAALIADQLPWDRCKNADTLCKVAQIYERTNQYRKSQKLLFMAYNQDDTSKLAVYRLGLLSVKMGRYEEAEKCYDKFVSLAPKDPNKYILEYKLLKAKNAPIERQIAVLEAFKSAEYLEEWGYELALLYHDAGMRSECVEECDDLILWFSESEYAYKAMELKSQYRPLSDKQIQRYGDKFGDTGSLMGTYSGDAAMVELEEESKEEESDEVTISEDEMAAVKESVAEMEAAVGGNVTAKYTVVNEETAKQENDVEETEVGISDDLKLVDSLRIDEILNEWDQKQSILDEPIEEETEAVPESTPELELDSILSEEVRQLMAELEAGLDSAVISGEISKSEEEKKIEQEEKEKEVEPVVEPVVEASVQETPVEEEEPVEAEAEPVENEETSEEPIAEPEAVVTDAAEVTAEVNQEEMEKQEEKEAADQLSKQLSEVPKEDTIPEIPTILDQPVIDKKVKKPEKEEVSEPTIPIKKPVPQDTGFIIEARYDLDATSEIGTKMGLNEEQTKIFSYFVPVRGMSEQIVEVLNHDRYCRGRAGSSRTGNVLVIGRKGSGKTVLAVDLIKAIQKQRQEKGGKVAIVNAASLNKKNISDIFLKLKGGALIVEQAGKLHPRTVEELNVEMEKQTGELLVILEEEKEPLKSLLRSNVRFAKKFTAKLEVPVFTNDELVTFAQTYAKENGYKLDDLAILALYSRIDSLQKENHDVSVAEVKDILDEAMNHSKKATAKKFMKRLRGKSEDEEGRIILNEKDFV